MSYSNRVDRLDEKAGIPSRVPFVVLVLAMLVLPVNLSVLNLLI